MSLRVEASIYNIQNGNISYHTTFSKLLCAVRMQLVARGIAGELANCRDHRAE